jgi:hypothetical protein
MFDRFRSRALRVVFHAVREVIVERLGDEGRWNHPARSSCGGGTRAPTAREASRGPGPPPA